LGFLISSVLTYSMAEIASLAKIFLATDAISAME
jgi:hypothetical protein